MSSQERAQLLRYGIALDAVILATGVGLLIPRPEVIATACLAATATSMWMLVVPQALAWWKAPRVKPPTRRPLHCTINLLTPRLPHNTRTKAAKRALPASLHARILLVERRRGTADTIVPRLRERGVETRVVERWVDAADELFRLKPDVVFIDVEHPEAELIRRTMRAQSPATPLVFTGSTTTPPTSLGSFPWLSRPYDPGEVERVAQHAF